MAMFHGKKGAVVWNAEDGTADVDIQHITSWSFDATADTGDATAMGDTWRTYLGGFKAWSANVECNADTGGPDVSLTTNETTTAGEEQGLGATWSDTDAATDAVSKVFLELWFDSTAATNGVLYGPAICTGISYNQDANDIAKVNYVFQGNGQVIFKSDAEPTDFVEPLS